jgi:hypothetical protein
MTERPVAKERREAMTAITVMARREAMKANTVMARSAATKPSLSALTSPTTPLHHRIPS